ncbi:hypothetical protein ACET8C_13855 [Aeromonas veronii]
MKQKGGRANALPPFPIIRFPCRHFAATIETSGPANQRKQLILNAF